MKMSEGTRRSKERAQVEPRYSSRIMTADRLKQITQNGTRVMYKPRILFRKSTCQEVRPWKIFYHLYQNAEISHHASMTKKVFGVLDFGSSVPSVVSAAGSEDWWWLLIWANMTESGGFTWRHVLFFVSGLGKVFAYSRTFFCWSSRLNPKLLCIIFY